MKLSTAVGSVVFRFPEEKAYGMFKNAGFDAVDISFFNKEEYTDELEPFYPLGRDYIERAKKQRRILDELGLSCNQTHAPYGLKFDDELSENNYRFCEFVRAIEATAILGAPHTVIHPIKPPSIDAVYDCNVKMLRALLPYCEKFNVKIALETCHLRYNIDGKSTVYFDSAEKYYGLIEDICSPYVVACIDLGHTAGGLSDYPEKFVADMPEGVLKGLHVQDCDYMHDNHTTPFFQKLNWDNIMRALSDIDYDGDLTFEDVNFTTHFPDELVESAIKYTAKVGRYLIDIFNKYESEKIKDF